MREGAREYFEKGIKKLVPLVTTCIKRDGDYVGKWSTNVSTISCKFISNTLFLKNIKIYYTYFLNIP
ncbi:MAG: hypothetical protein ACTS4Y_01745, partial [Candidatus Hodgkinia cicadicola]